jgi:hypothetical protein
MTEKNEVHWNPQLERILSSEGERALCFTWLHTRSEKRYAGFTNYVALPSIILSTVNGFISAAGGALTNNPVSLSIGVGVVSMGIGMLNTMTTYFAWAKRAEAHRLTASQYSRVHRAIMLELALPRPERIRAHDFLKITRDQLDRLYENAPNVPDTVIAEFKRHFGDSTPEVSKPEITNGLDPIEVYIDEDNRRVKSSSQNSPSSHATTPAATPPAPRVVSVSPS